MPSDLDLSAANDAPVLVTGASEHVGGYSIARLLDAGYRVRATVREPDQRDQVLARVRQSGVNADGRVLFVTASLTSDEGWAAAVNADRVPPRELTDEEVREGAKTDPALRPAAGLRGQVPVISSEKARTVLGWSPRDVEATITDTADSLIRLGLVSA